MTNIVLTQTQIKNASKAMEKLYSILSSQPSYIGDYMSKSQLENIYRSMCVLSGKRYKRSDYFDSEDKDE